MKAYLSPHGITNKQYNILRILKGANKPVSTAYVRERLLDKLSDVSRIVERMETKGLIKKNTCTKDKRLVDLVLTKKGLDMVNELSSNTDFIDQLLQNLDNNEINQLNHLLDKIRTH